MYEPLAIVGTACRLPGGATTSSKLWDLLREPKDALRDFQPDRLATRGFYSDNPDRRGRSHVLHKSYLLEEDTRHFDNAFFDTNPKDAAEMDPQQRLLMETTYEAFESAGWSLEDVYNSQTSVHVGVMTDDYSYIQTRDPENLGGRSATGLSRSILSNRLSYAFNLRGSSITLDTACSSSLVALHLAAQGLQRGESTAAVVAGTNLLLDSAWYIIGSSMHMISPESRSRMWDKEANGYARGEGCAVVVLKTLAQAIRDNDHIECVIRGTGVNSDGQADGSGITIPNADAQTELIRRTYRDAGLDIVKDRPQYFEAHGTGTQAGDPNEAKAIYDAFFDTTGAERGGRLLIGSIKTVIGHLEGCAGLAGLIKASLAIQNKAIPPNMLFNELNEKIEPYYGRFQIPTALLPWPETEGPRRASVNSFGFGGTNAHAILESYEPSTGTQYLTDLPNGTPVQADAISAKLSGPFVFSARTKTSLVNWLKKLLNHLRSTDSVDLDSMSHTLFTKRSIFRYKATIPAATGREDLIEKLEDQINIVSTQSKPRSAPSSSTGVGFSILGIFTGQGAQAARMAHALLQHSSIFRQSIDVCEKALASIPNPPTWSLSEEIMADAENSRVSEAQFSQPLCTAIQIGLVDLLSACGLHFSAVVGHSSGEIGAAYAAGLLTRRDAMGIAHYRGCVSHLARGESGQSGAMMAASLSLEAAEEVCSEPQFKGRVTVAASNSPSSVTISGDEDAILELKDSLEERGITARKLQVDTAYHSHHMRPCAEKYMNYLRELDITIQTPPTDRKTHWHSSVRPGTMIESSALTGQYWVDNLTSAVLFSQAVQVALQSHPDGFSAAIEVGPHAALRGPVNQTLKQSVAADRPLPYTSCLTRGKNAIESFAEAISIIWTLSPTAVRFSGWREAFNLPAQSPPLKSLPPYAWDHTQIHWRESRVGRNYRLNPRPPHDLLGRLWTDSGSEQTWRNMLRLSEMPWLKGHVFQSQILFPATGYVSLAIDAAKVFVQEQPIKFIEISDMSIPRALPVGDGEEVEILFTIRSRPAVHSQHKSDAIIETDFTCFTYADGSDEADKTCEGLLKIYLGESGPTDLAPTEISDIELTPFNVGRFYHAASEIGFAYDGPFRALNSMNKVWGHAKSTAQWSSEDPDMNVVCSLHPAILDNALQTGLSTILSAAENSMHSPYLPVGFKRALIDPNQDYNTNVTIEAYMTSPVVGLGPRILTDINIKSSSTPSSACGIQMEGVTFKALSEPQPSEDRNILAKTVWGHDAAYGLISPTVSAAKASIFSPEDYERVALFHLLRLGQSVSAQEIEDLQPHQRMLVNAINVLTAKIRKDRNGSSLQMEWLNDTSESIADLLSRDPKDKDMKLLLSGISETQSALKGRPITEREDKLYRETTWNAASDTAIGMLVAQISHTFPRVDILHFCGSAAGTVDSVLDEVGDAYGTYTCADSSPDVVDALRQAIGLDRAKEKRISFDSSVDIENKTRRYDVVICSDICSSRQDLDSSISRLRGLMRPGGHLISLELTGKSLRPMCFLGSSKTWWENSGVDAEIPGINTGEWDDLLCNNGFSGVDAVFHDQSKLDLHGYSVFSAQAMDDRMEILRNPRNITREVPPTTVVLIGGESSPVSSLIRQAKTMLRGWAPEVQVWRSFDKIDCARLQPGCAVINLQDLDKPLFSSPPSVNEIKNLHTVLERAHNILWLTSGRLVSDPYANIMQGIARALRHELMDLQNIQFLDFEPGQTWEIGLIVDQLLRLIFTGSSSIDMDGLLWSKEPEINIRKSGRVTPRVVLDSHANEIYNASRRRVTKAVDLETPLELDHQSSSEPFLAVARPCNPPKGLEQMHVKLSVKLHANGEAQRFLSYGTVEGSEVPALTVSDTDSSIVAVAAGMDVSSQIGQELDASILAKLATVLIASHLISQMPEAGTTLVHGVSDGLAQAISVLAVERSRNVVFVTVDNETQQKERLQWIYVHPQTPARTIKKLLPQDVAALYDLSGNATSFLVPHLPPGNTVKELDTGSLTQQSIEAAIEFYVKHQSILDQVSTPLVSTLLDLRHSSTSDRLSIVTDWERSGPVSASIRALDPYSLISPDKTYFLVGMASELGQSLAYFLVRGGARYIVLSSRNPKPDTNWLRDLRANGVDIRVVKMDVTDRAQVQQTVKMLRETMPEIGGVTNAALVLEPAIFSNLSAASIAKQMMPKIQGTVNLDEVFEGHPLDWMLYFGSLGTTFGNPGHAIYHAGNAFMRSWVANRKARGLNASILNFGMLVDVGYVARADRNSGTSDVEDFLRGDGLVALSEAEFHHVILEGISIGKPESPLDEVIMGAGTYIDRGQTPKPRWLGTSTLSHLVREVSDAADGDLASFGSHQLQLESATTTEEAILPVTELFSQKIEAMIHVSLDSIHPDEPLSRLGIDSINAIGIRKWLLDTFRAEIPMVRLLGRDPSSSIIRSISEQYIAKRPAGAATATIAVKEDTQAPAKAHQKLDAEALASTQPTNTPDTRGSSTSKGSSVTVADTPATSSASDSMLNGLDFTRSAPLSVAQEGLLYIDKFSEARTALNLTTRWKIEGPLDVQKLNLAMERTINRHDALRTCFFAKSDVSEVQQHVVAARAFQITQVNSSPETGHADALKIFDKMKEYEYVLEAADTFQATIVRHDGQSHTLILGISNVVIDVLSVGIIMDDIDREYQSKPWSQNRSRPAPSYLDYTLQQLNDINAGRLRKDVEYWTKHLSPLPEPLPLLPIAKVQARENRRAYGSHFTERELSANFVENLTRICDAHNVNPMQWYLATLQVFLYRLLDIDDLVIGMTNSGRDPTTELSLAVGHIATILPMRFKKTQGSSFPDVLNQTKTTLLEGFAHAYVPFAHLVDQIRPTTREGNMPVIQVAYNYMDYEKLQPALGDCSLGLEEADHTTVYDFVMDVQRSASGSHMLGFKCSDDFYSEAATHFIAETFFSMLENLVSNPLTAVEDCKLFSEAQLDDAKSMGSSPAIQSSWPETLSDRFNEVAVDFADLTAIKEGNTAVSYRELSRKVGLYASILAGSNARVGSRIAVFCTPSVDLYTMMLAIWHIGAVFIPLDVSVPAARRNDIIAASQPLALVFHEATAKDVAESHESGKVKHLNITHLAQVHPKNATIPARGRTQPDSVSHIMFTSGSTGKPKGINLHQRGIMNFTAFTSKRYKLGQIRVLQQTSIGFDVSFSQVFTALANGGTLVVAPFASRGDPDMLSKLILDEKVEWTMCTPSEYNLLLTYAPERMRQCKDWRFAGAGGEVLPDRLIDGLRDLELPKLLLTNWYGPTEVTVATSQEIPVSAGSSPLKNEIILGSLIGNIVPNTSVYILDENDGSLLPPGMPGEICVGGVMVANGYLDQDLNRDTFVNNPFASPQDRKQGFSTMYKTGDRGILRDDGSVIFLGRTKRGSTTIKLRGLRIDLNEVTGSILAAAPDDLADAAVTVRGDPQFLVCHVAFRPGRHLEQHQLTELLLNLTLPRYMIPAVIVAMDRLPRVPNGKIDLELLREIELPKQTYNSLTNGETKLTKTEQRLRSLWKQTLGELAEHTEVGAHSSFMEIGGNSFSMIRLQNGLSKHFGLKLPLSKLWRASELRDMALLVEKESVTQQNGV